MIKGVKITPDLIMSVGMSIALVVAIFCDTPAEITTGIVCGMSGYLGQVITGDDKEKGKKKEEA